MDQGALSDSLLRKATGPRGQRARMRGEEEEMDVDTLGDGGEKEKKNREWQI